MRKTKRELQLYSFYDITGMERHLEKMAAKGWMLEKATPFSWTYRRCEPKTVHFAVTYYPPASAFQPEPGEGQQTFTDFCDHAGWRCAASYAQLMVFVNEQENPVPIHTDPIPEIESLERMAKRTTWAWWLLLAMLLFQTWTFVDFLLRDPVSVLSSTVLLSSQLMMVLLALYALSELVTWHRWRKRARAAAENGEFVHTHGHQGLLIAAVAFLVLGLLGGLLVDRQPGLGRFLLILLAAYLLIYCLINGVRVFLQKKKVSTARNRFITMTVSILLSLALCVVLNWLLFHMERPASKATEMAVTIQDLTGDTDDDLIEQSSIHTSLLMSCRDFTQHSPYDQPSENRMTLHYTQSDIRFSPLYDTVLDRAFHKYDRFYTEDETSHTRLYRETNPTPWGAQAVYQYEYDGTPDSSYILCWPGRIVEFHASWFLTEEQMSIVGSCFSQ